MQLRITKKKNKNDRAMLNLGKAVKVRQIPDGRKRLTLEITWGPDCCDRYRDSEYVFEEQELSAAGMVSYNELTVPKIVELAMLD